MNGSPNRFRCVHTFRRRVIFLGRTNPAAWRRFNRREPPIDCARCESTVLEKDAVAGHQQYC
jgi:hypothetical protein